MALSQIVRFTQSIRRHCMAPPMGAALIALGLGGVVAGGAMAVSPTVDTTRVFKREVTVAEPDVPPQAANGRHAFTVPAGRNFMLTDLVISNDSDTSPAADQFIAEGADANCSDLLGAARMSTVKVPAGGTLHVPFVTGIRFKAGEIVCIINLDATDQTDWTIRGYLFE